MRKSIMKALARQEMEKGANTSTGDDIKEAQVFVRRGLPMLLDSGFFEIEDVKSGSTDVLFDNHAGMDVMEQFQLASLFNRVQEAMHTLRTAQSESGLRNVFRRGNQYNAPITDEVQSLALAGTRIREYINQHEGRSPTERLMVRKERAVRDVTLHQNCVQRYYTRSSPDDYGFTRSTGHRVVYQFDGTEYEDDSDQWGSIESHVVKLEKNWWASVFISGLAYAAPRRHFVTSASPSGEFTAEGGIVYNVESLVSKGRSQRTASVSTKKGKAVCISVEGKKFWGVAAQKHNAARIARENASAALVSRLTETQGANSSIGGGFL